MRRPELSPGAKLAYARLRLYAGSNVGGYPLLATLGRELAASRRQAARYVAELKRHGLIGTERKPGRKSNWYKLLSHPWTSAINGTGDNSGVLVVSEAASPLVTDAAHRKEEPEKRVEKSAALAVALPAVLDTPKFRAGWNEWQEHRRQSRKKLTPLAAQRQLSELAAAGEQQAIARIKNAVAHDWLYPYPLKENHHANTPRRALTDDDHRQGF